MKKFCIKANWIQKPSYCEYCSSFDHETYLPFTKSTTRNPQRMCIKCAKSEGYSVLTSFNDRNDYFIELEKLQENS